MESTGDFEQKVKISPRTDALNTYGISPSELRQLIQANHIAFPAGIITDLQIETVYDSSDEVKKSINRRAHGCELFLFGSAGRLVNTKCKTTF